MDNNRALGFRFYPTEEELISFYLLNKLQGTRPDLHRVIPVLDIYSFDPWQLPEFSGELCRGDGEQWFFFVPRQERDARGEKTSRTTSSGYWKATGSPSYAYSSGYRIIGVKKTMVFYRGKVPNGRKTGWKMNEYRAILTEPTPSSSSSSSSMSATPYQTLRNEYSLCRVYVGSGSLRAFDRRPTEANTSSQIPMQVSQAPAASEVAAVSTSRNDDTTITSQALQIDESNIWENFNFDLQNLSEWTNFNWD